MYSVVDGDVSADTSVDGDALADAPVDADVPVCTPVDAAAPVCAAADDIAPFSADAADTVVPNAVDDVFGIIKDVAPNAASPDSHLRLHPANLYQLSLLIVQPRKQAALSFG